MRRTRRWTGGAYACWPAGGILVGALAPLLQTLLPADGARLQTAQVHIPVVFTLGAWSAACQTDAAGSRRQRTRRRPYSVLPYAAVALLLAVATGNRDDLVMVSVAAVALTALVATRQLTALRDNARLVDRLDHLATHDALTGLANRALFQRHLNKALGAPPDRPVAVALIHLDDFKQINDTLGHETGDQLLVAVAARLAGCMRAGDTVARLGGDEFVVVFDGAGPTQAAETARRIIEALSEPVRAGNRDLPVRASIGMAGGHGGSDAGELLRRADTAMFAAKKIPGPRTCSTSDPRRPRPCRPSDGSRRSIGTHLPRQARRGRCTVRTSDVPLKRLASGPVRNPRDSQVRSTVQRW